MTRERTTDELHPEPGDAGFVARLKAEYAPQPQGAARRQEFLRELEARIERRRGRRRLLLALAGAGAAGAVAWLLLAPPPAPERTPSAGGEPLAASQPGEQWDMQLFYADELLDDDAGDDATAQALPEEYAAIANVFLDD
jgi:ferric-dicitrate binding protein FerR (iron transport regulator)